MKTSIFAKLIVWGSIALSVVTAGVITLSATGAVRVTNPNLTYSCKFYNYDDTFLYSCNVAPTHDAVYNGPMPERADTLHSRYLFKGWDNNLENITENKVFHALFQEKKKDYLVTFVNYDGTLLYENYFEAGDVPHYGGEEPTKVVNDSYTYSFKGWDKTIVPVYENTVYTAVFDKAEIFLNTTFLNYDNSVLYRGRVPYNGVAYYNARTPSRPSTSVIKYKFKGWDKSLYGIVEDTVFIAQYDEEIPTYVVTFVNYNGEFLSSTTVNYNEGAVYTGPTPRRQAEGDYVYVFTGWDKTFDCVTEDMIVTAQFESTIPEFTVEFRNYDNSVLGSDVVKMGENASYDGETPTRPDDDAYSYKFIGWDRSLDNIRSSFFTIAEYEAQPKIHTVVFKNYDESVLDTQEVIHGEQAFYGGEYPTRPSDLHYEYHFKGWSEDLTEILSDLVVYAEYDLDPIENSHDNNGNSGGGGNEQGGESSGTHNSEGADQTSPYSEPVPEEDDGEEEKEKLWYKTKFLNYDLVLIKDDITLAGKEPYFPMNDYGDKLVRVDPSHPTYNFTFQDFIIVPWLEENVSNPFQDYAYMDLIAQYTVEIDSKQYYSVCFRNDDETLIKEVFCEYGETPVFPSTLIPQPKSFYHRGCVFSGWDTEIEPVTKSVTYFAKYSDNASSVTNGKITVNSTPIPNVSNTIMSYSTQYSGYVYFRELSYSDLRTAKRGDEVYSLNEWLRFNPYNLPGVSPEDVISPLEFTADKLKQTSSIQYSMQTSVYSNYKNYFSFHPSYLCNTGNLSKSDAYLIASNSETNNYTFIPQELDLSTISLLKANSYSNSNYTDQEYLYRSYAKQCYTNINDTSLRNFIANFVSVYQLKAESVKQILDVRDFLRNYASFVPNYNKYQDNKDAIVSFLETGKKGDSTHFAAALTCIYRYLGVPARYVTGARSLSNGGYGFVTTDDISAWTEVYINNVGWVIMDASVDASGGGTDPIPGSENIFNPFGEIDRERQLMTVVVSPYQSSKYYDGLSMGVQYSITGSLPGGDHIEVNTLPGEKSVGKYVTRACPRVYNSIGEDVTSKYVGRIEMIYEDYTINKATIKITTGSASKNYDGKALVCHEYTVENVYGARAYSDEIIISFTGSQTKRGSSPNFVDLENFTIKSSNNEDVLKNYNVIWVYGRLTVN